jgi:hypothetical protein
MTTARFDVDDGFVEVSLSTVGWHRKVPNGIGVTVDRRGRRTIVSVGDIGDTRVDQVPVFDPGTFDPDIAAAFVRYWGLDYPGLQHGWAKVRVRLSPLFIHISWEAWTAISLERRRAFLRAAVTRFGSVTVNGQELANWRGVRSILGLGP